MALCVVINGPSSVGKSTLVTGLQDRAAIPLLRFGVDELYRMVPAQWAGGTKDAAHADRGFRYEADVSADDTAGRRIANGVDAVQMLHAMGAGVLGMVRAGHHVIVDGQAYEPEVNDEFHRSLRGASRAGELESSIVELTGGAADLLSRQARHAHPAGLAVSQSRRGPLCPDPDLMIDTTSRSGPEVLNQVWDWLLVRHHVLRGLGDGDVGGYVP
jgi:chloramphenicol 3-O-phosphotransferase